MLRNCGQDVKGQLVSMGIIENSTPESISAASEITGQPVEPEKKDTYHFIERSYDSIDRSFRLPEAANQEDIKADLTKACVIPKRPEAVKAETKIPIVLN